jgi:uroporphyrin-III C-methyltransferase/precorrin-2 dehydrogenase/sirohydrochlorin ferrochelatase
VAELLPLFANLEGRRVLLVGGGAVAASKLTQLLAAGAVVRVVAPDVRPELERGGIAIDRRPFQERDLDDVWLVVSAATPEVNRMVAEAAEARRVFVNAVDDPAHASVFLGGVVRREGVTLAISTSGDAPGLTALLRQALDSLLPAELGRWVRTARHLRRGWKRAQVPMEVRRPLLLEALNRLYTADGQGPTESQPDLLAEVSSVPADRGESHEGREPQRSGFVSLVGAGPGDPGLLTRQAVARLRAADLVLYDALVDDRVLRLAGRAQRFFVGKRAKQHTLTQSDINAAMIRAARRGRRVVRLKGGDPFVFGRGGEEAIALANAGVPFEIVPGVTSAVAAPALAGIPVTHRGIASAFLVISGHDEQAFAATVANLTPNTTTVVVMMGMGNRAVLASILLERGWARGTPSALVAEASLPTQAVWRGTLGDLAGGRASVESRGPALFVVGEVAAMDLLAAEAITEDAEKRSRG